MIRQERNNYSIQLLYWSISAMATVLSWSACNVKLRRLSLVLSFLEFCREASIQSDIYDNNTIRYGNEFDKKYIDFIWKVYGGQRCGIVSSSEKNWSVSEVK